MKTYNRIHNWYGSSGPVEEKDEIIDDMLFSLALKGRMPSAEIETREVLDSEIGKPRIIVQIRAIYVGKKKARDNYKLLKSK